MCNIFHHRIILKTTDEEEKKPIPFLKIVLIGLLSLVLLGLGIFCGYLSGNLNLGWRIFVVVILVIIGIVIFYFLHRHQLKQIKEKVEKLQKSVRGEINGKITELVGELYSKKLVEIEERQKKYLNDSIPNCIDQNVAKEVNELLDDVLPVLKKKIDILEDITKGVSSSLDSYSLIQHHSQPKLHDKVKILEEEVENIRERIDTMKTTIKCLPSKEPEIKKVEERECSKTVFSSPSKPLLPMEQISSPSEKVKEIRRIEEIERELSALKKSVEGLEKDRKSVV